MGLERVGPTTAAAEIKGKDAGKVGGWVGGRAKARPGIAKSHGQEPRARCENIGFRPLGSEILVKTMALSSQGSKLLVKTMVLRSSCSLPAGPPKRFFKKWLRIVAFYNPRIVAHSRKKPAHSFRRGRA